MSENQETVRRTRRLRRGNQPQQAGAPTHAESQTTRRIRRQPRPVDPTAEALAGPSRKGRRLRAQRAVDTRTPFGRAPAGARRWWVAIDAVAILALLGLLAIAFEPTFGTARVFVPVLGGGLLGMLIGWVGWRWRLNTGAVALVMVAAWFLFGGPLAMPSSMQAFVVPTMRTLRGLAVAPVTAWKDMLTLTPPIGETWNLLAVPLLLAMVVGVTSMAISLRTHRPQLAWLPGAVALGIGWVLGTQTTRWPLWSAIAVVAVVVLWTTHRRRMLRETLVRQRRSLQWHQVVLGALVLAVGAVATFGAAGFVRPDGARVTARSAVAPPLDVQRYASPLQQLRGMHAMHSEDVMFTINRAPANAAIRLATLDTYNGLTYNVSNDASPVDEGGTFNRVGARIEPGVNGTEVEIDVLIAKLTGVWVPTIGQTTSIKFNGPRAVALGDNFYYNRVSGTGLNSAGVTSGDGYTVTAVIPQRPSDETIAAANAAHFPQPEMIGVPDLLREQALTWTERTSTKGEAALKLVEQLRLGYYSNGLPEQTKSLSGHSADRLTNLLLNPQQMVGDEEQYAVTMAVMARSLNIPARVVYGFQTPAGGSGDVRGQDVRAWTELNLAGLGWVMFNPTPDHDRILKQQTTRQPPRPRPHIDNPPPPPRRPDKLPNDTNLPTNQGEAPVPPTRIDWARVGTLFAIIAVPVLALFGPLALIIGLKGRRRLTRKNHPQVANRVAGAWSELVDRVRDLGKTPPPTATRTEQAEQMVVAFPKMITDADPINLAKRADAMVFSPESVSEEQAGAYWKTMKEAEKGVRRSVGWRRWITSRLSVRSFRAYK